MAAREREGDRWFGRAESIRRATCDRFRNFKHVQRLLCHTFCRLSPPVCSLSYSTRFTDAALFLRSVSTHAHHPDQLNAEEYETLDNFEDDLKLMADEAKEVRDRLKADLAAAEAHAAALERGAAAAGAAESGVVVGGGAAGGSGSGGGGGGANGGRGGGDDAGLRRALMEVDRATNRLARAATAVDMACFLRDAALSFLLE